MAKSATKKPAKQEAKPKATGKGGQAVELTEAELSKVAGGLGVVKRTPPHR